MKQETHKEQMKRLKKFDPITYYEMHSNPTGSDSDDGLFGFFATVAILATLVGIAYLFLLSI